MSEKVRHVLRQIIGWGLFLFAMAVARFPAIVMDEHSSAAAAIAGGIGGGIAALLWFGVVEKLLPIRE